MTRKPVYAAVTAGAAALIVTTTVALTHDASATTGQAARAEIPPAGISAEHFAAVQRDLHLTAAQARQRLDTDRTAGQVQALYQATKAETYAGTYVAPDGKVVVNVTDAAAGTRARAQGAAVRVVKHTGARLDAQVAKLDRARRPAGIVDWHADVVANTVVVRAATAKVAAVRDWLAAKKYDTGAIRVEATDESPRPLIDIIGGSAYYIGSGTRCSVGFAVTVGFVTAGHCGRTGATTTQPSGTFAGSSFPGNDYAYVRAAAGNTPRGLVRNGAGTITVTGSTQAAVGSTVCRSGSTTGWHCGTIHAFNSSVTYPEGTITGLIRTNVCAEPGDSGGSLVAGSQAQGVTSGGSGNCSSGGTTYFQPVNEPLQVYGLTLVTGGSTPPGPGPTATTTPPGGNTTWAPGRYYAAGTIVTYNGVRYRCQVSHTANVGWEPPNVPALWARA